MEITSPRKIQENRETELQKKDVSLYCPQCGLELQENHCKLICPGCKYYMSCSDYY